MSDINMFEKAARIKLRFATEVGKISVEELWDLPLTSAKGVSLDSIAIALNSALNTTQKSFVKKQSDRNALIELSFDIVKYIIDVRSAEAEEKANKIKREQERDRLDDLIKRKQDQQLESLPLEDLIKLRDNI